MGVLRLDRRLRGYFERELGYLRGAAALFAGESPKIAGRLGIDRFGCSDPYVERVIQSAAFSAARTRLELDARFPIIADGLVERGFPLGLADMPSMAVASLQPDTADDGLSEGPILPAGSAFNLQSEGSGVGIPMRSAHSVRVWPLRIEQARYDIRNRDQHQLPRLALPTRAAFVLSIGSAIESLRGLPIDALSLFVGGPEEAEDHLFGALAFDAIRVWARETGGTQLFELEARLESDGRVRAALPPPAHACADPLRYAMEWAACPARTRFIEISGLREITERIEGSSFEIVFALGRAEVSLEDRVTADDVSLFATPLVNLHEVRDVRVPAAESGQGAELSTRGAEPVLLRGVRMVFPGKPHPATLEPFGGAGAGAAGADGHRYTVERRPQASDGRGYSGGRWRIRTVDTDGHAITVRASEFSVDMLASSGSAAMEIAEAAGIRCTPPAAAPVAGARLLVKPSPPHENPLDAGAAWEWLGRLGVSALALDDPDGGGLRDLLGPLAAGRSPVAVDAVASIRAVRSRRELRRLPDRAGVAQGLGIEVIVDEGRVGGHPVVSLVPVLDAMFPVWVSPESFTRLVVRDTAGTAIAEFEPRPGVGEAL